MIVAVCGDKGSPGVTTLALALGVVWPGERLVVEMDPAGGDLAFGLGLGPEPTVLSLATDARAGLAEGALGSYAQLVPGLGIAVLPGALNAERFAPMARLWPQVAGESARWPGTVIADLGRLLPGSPSLVVAQAAGTVLVVARPTVGGLHRLRDRVAVLAAATGRAGQEQSPVAVVMVCRSREERSVLEQTRRMLESAGSVVRVVGFVADDPGAVELLWSGRMTRALQRSELLRSARTLAEVLAGQPLTTSAAGTAVTTAAGPRP